MTRRAWGVPLLLAVWFASRAGVCSAAAGVPAAPGCPPGSEAESLGENAEGLLPATEALLVACFDDSNNLDFGPAEAEARAAMALQPDSPVPVLALLAELTNQIQELRTAHAGFSAPQARFQAALAEAFKLDRARGARTHDAQSLLYLGDTLGLQGLVELSAGHLFAAYRHGQQGYQTLLKAKRLDPNLIDADLGIGEYLFYCGRLSGFVRTILDMPGNVPKGIAIEERCAAKAGPLTARQARVNLAEILTEEVPDYRAALPYVREVETLYPRNWASEKEALDEARGLGLDDPAARALVEAVAARWDSGWRPPAYKPLDPGTLRLALARWYLAHGRGADARRHLQALASGGGPEAGQASGILGALGQP